jgi:hypothetical protein
MIDNSWGCPDGNRAAYGISKSIRDLIKVKGIGMTLIKKNRDSITIDTGPDSDC